MRVRPMLMSGALLGSLLVAGSGSVTARSDTFESSAVTDLDKADEIAINPKLAVVDEGFIGNRSNFGLPVDSESMRRAVDDTWDRRDDDDPLGDPLGVPLSDAELELARDYVRITTKDSTPLHDYLAANSDTVAELVWDVDIDDPSITIQVTKEFSGDASTFERLVPEGLRWEVATVDFSKDQLDAVFMDYIAETNNDTSKFGIRSALASLGMRPLEASFTNGAQTLTVVVEERGEERSPELLTNSANEALSAVAGVPPIEVQKQSPDVLAGNKDDSPGPGKGGLRIRRNDNNTACTTGFSARVGVKVYVLTAGHCRNGNNRFTHSGTTGADYGFPRDTLTVVSNAGGGNIWARDHAYLDENTTSTGIGSGYYMRITSSGAISLQAVTGMNTSNEGNSGTVVCQDGASPNRYQILTSNNQRNLCGAILAINTLGKIRVNANVCRGDSGGPVRSGTTAYGLVSAAGNGGYNLSNDCGQEFTYVRIQNALADEQASLVTTSNDNPMMLQNDIFTPNGTNDCQNSACCLSASGPPPATSNYTNYLQWTCLQDNGNQDFYFQPVASTSPYDTDHYRLIRFNGNTAYCLSVDGNSGDGGNGTGNWSNIHSWLCLGTPTSPNPKQVWDLRYESGTPNGFFEMRSAGSTTRCLSVSGGPTQNDRGANVHLWTCGNANDAQVWKVR